MGIKNEDDNKSPRKPFIYYYLIVMIVMILFNALMVPWIQSRTVIEVPYSTFLEKVDAGQVTDVARTDSEIQFIANTGEKDKNGKEIVKVGGIISPLQPGAKTQFNTSMTLDYANTYDFKITLK